MRPHRALAVFAAAAALLASCAIKREIWRPDVATYHPTRSSEEQTADRTACERQAKQASRYDPATGSGISTFTSTTDKVISWLTSDYVSGVLTGAELKQLRDRYTREYSACLQAQGYILK